MRALYLANRQIDRRMLIEVMRFPLDSSDTAGEVAREALDGKRRSGEWPASFRQLGPIEADSLDDLIGQHPEFFFDGWSVVHLDGADPREIPILDPLTDAATDLYVCPRGEIHTRNRQQRRHPRTTRRPR